MFRVLTFDYIDILSLQRIIESYSSFSKNKYSLEEQVQSCPASMEADLSQTALLLIDCQKGFEHPTHWGHTRSNPDFESNLTALLEAFRSIKHGEHSSPPIIHIIHQSSDPHSPLSPDGPGADFLPYAKPRAGELVISKTVNSAFIGTDLEERIRADGIRRLYIAGLTTSIPTPSMKESYDIVRNPSSRDSLSKPCSSGDVPS